jgi:KilA-N domain
LDDLWRAAKAKETRLPKHWRTMGLAKALINELQKKVTTGNIKGNSPLIPVIYSKVGRGNEGTFAHPIIAAAYAGYLSPKLEIEVREIWLRFRSGDATLADEILQRATAEANKWAGARALARSERVSYTGVLKQQGVEGKGYMRCTEAVYVSLLGGKSFQLRERRGLAPKVNLRDNLDMAELSYVMAAEALSSERILEENRQGNAACEEASSISARAIRRAIEEDRRNRQKNLV